MHVRLFDRSWACTFHRVRLIIGRALDAKETIHRGHPSREVTINVHLLRLNYDPLTDLVPTYLPAVPTDPEDADELHAGCAQLAAMADANSRPGDRRLLAVRALRMLADRGCRAPDAQAKPD